MRGFIQRDGASRMPEYGFAGQSCPFLAARPQDSAKHTNQALVLVEREWPAFGCFLDVMLDLAPPEGALQPG